jgi:hypothetical protein
MADRVHAPMDEMKAAERQAPVDRAGAKAQLDQLPSRNRPVLALREDGKGRVDATCAGFASHMRVNPARLGISPPGEPLGPE